MSKTKVLVTGGSGLVGSAVKYVIENEQGRFGGRDDEEWVFVGSGECDLRSYIDTKELFDKHKPDYVLHLAAKVGGLFANMKEPATFMNDNVAMNDSVLRNAHELGVRKVVSCLSTCIFPDKVEYPLTEDKVHLGPPHQSNFGYAYAKRMVDVQNKAYNQQYGDKFTSVIPTNVFGPHDNYNLSSAHVIPALIHKCYKAKQAGSPLIVGGSGKPLRQFIYSRDLARLMIWAVREYDDVEPLILSPAAEDEISILDVASSIAKAMKQPKLEMDPSLPDGQYRKPASNAKLASLLPDFKFTPFEDALEESVTWFVDNYDSARR